ncbi:MAG: LysE family transporter [Spirochaetes bacterium]|nr:LysE family transporter [Spirochaetota bacterium]
MEWSIPVAYAALLCYGLVLGFLSAIPIGAVQLQVVKLSFAGRRRAAIATAIGSGTSDLFYGVLTLFGLAPVLREERFQALFYMLGAAVLAFLLYRSARDLRRPGGGEEAVAIGEARGGFILGFTLAVTNPGIVLWWIIGFRVFVDFSLFAVIATVPRVLFVLSGVAGLVGYLVMLTLAVGRFRRDVPAVMMRRLNLAIVVILAALVLYFVYRAARLIAG